MDELSRTAIAPARRTAIAAEGSRAGAFAAIDWGLFGFCGLVWGSSFYFIAVGVDHFSPPLIAAIRLALGTAVLAVARKARRPVDRSDLPRIALLALVWMAIPFTLFPVAEQWVDSGVTGVINAGFPVFTAILAVVLLRRLPRLRQTAGLLLGLGGVVVVALPTLGEGGSSVLGIVLLLVAVVLYAVAITVAVPLQQRYGALPVMMRMQGLACLMTLPLAIWGVGRSDFAGARSPPSPSSASPEPVWRCSRWQSSRVVSARPADRPSRTSSRSSRSPSESSSATRRFTCWRLSAPRSSSAAPTS